MWEPDEFFLSYAVSMGSQSWSHKLSKNSKSLGICQAKRQSDRLSESHIYHFPPLIMNKSCRVPLSVPSACTGMCPCIGHVQFLISVFSDHEHWVLITSNCHIQGSVPILDKVINILLMQPRMSFEYFIAI